MNSKDEQMKQIQKLIVEFVKQFGPSSGKQLLNITDYIAKPVLQALVDGEHVGKLELLRENADNDENVYQNGSYTRNVKWGKEEIPIKMKRIRGENQDSQIIPKYQRIIHDKFILDVLSLASTRLSNNEIADQITSMYGFKVSPSVISNCIQTVQDEMRDWHERPLENNYPIIMIDGKVFKIKTEESGRSKYVNKTLYVVVGINADGQKELIALYVSNTESATEWMNILDNLKERGLSEACIIVSDGLKGLKEAIENVYPKAMHITCTVHMIRNAAKYVSHSMKSDFLRDLKNIYGADNWESAKTQLWIFKNKWGGSNKRAVEVVERAMDNIEKLFSFSKALRTLVYTSNIVENYNSVIGSFLAAKKSFNNINQLLLDLYVHFGYNPRYKKLNQKSNRVRNWYRIYEELMDVFPNLLNKN
ncbi:IS256 family transposase [Mycoplasmoides gallisepticum]|uniref:IS256 family transposase n=1 Tax=Mycoplasmoides gallisepticum TaxID=2096 RepID=UPI003704756F